MQIIPATHGWRFVWLSDDDCGYDSLPVIGWQPVGVDYQRVKPLFASLAISSDDFANHPCLIVDAGGRCWLWQGGRYGQCGRSLREAVAILRGELKREHNTKSVNNRSPTMT